MGHGPGPNAQDVLGTPTDTPVHLILSEEELDFEWMAPKGTSEWVSGRRVPGNAIVYQAPKLSRLNAHAHARRCMWGSMPD